MEIKFTAPAQTLSCKRLTNPSLAYIVRVRIQFTNLLNIYQLGPQQLKYMMVLRDSSACLSLSEVEVLRAEESMALEKRLACLEEEG